MQPGYGTSYVEDGDDVAWEYEPLSLPPSGACVGEEEEIAARLGQLLLHSPPAGVEELSPRTLRQKASNEAFGLEGTTSEWLMNAYGGQMDKLFDTDYAGEPMSPGAEAARSYHRC